MIFLKFIIDEDNLISTFFILFFRFKIVYMCCFKLIDTYTTLLVEKKTKVRDFSNRVNLGIQDDNILKKKKEIDTVTKPTLVQIIVSFRP